MFAIMTTIPGFIAAWVGFKRSPQHAFLYVYLPSMLLLPEYYRWDAPGLPDPTFGQAAIIGTFAAFLARKAPGYRFSFTDILVAGFALSASVSQYLAAGYADAQNLMFNMLTWVVMPYVLAKSLIEPLGLRIRFAQVVVLLLAFIALISAYEFKFASTPWRMILDPFFPYQGRGWITTFRWGFARIAGPFGHAILAGVLMVVAFRIQRWLEWSQAWPTRLAWAPWLPISPARLITLILLAGIIMTMVRGPWIGAILASLVVLVGRSRFRVAAMSGVVVMLLLVGVPTVIWFLDYVSVGRAGALTVAQESAAYRWELLTEYGGIAAEKLWLGWGLTAWPKVPGMPSIDNYYLLLLLMHGLLGLGFFLAVLFGMFARLLLRGMREPLSEPAGSSLSFTLASIYLAFLISIGTVYLGLQAIPVLFLITGWAESYLQRGQTHMVMREQHDVTANAQPSFRRVMT